MYEQIAIDLLKMEITVTVVIAVLVQLYESILLYILDGHPLTS